MRSASFQTYTFITNMIKGTDILHKTTYIWKEEVDFTVIIKSNGEKVILNSIDSLIWKNINDDDTVEEIGRKLSASLTQDELCRRLDEFIKIGIVTNEDMFWGG